MEDRLFKDVFQGIKLDDDVEEFFEDLYVSGIEIVKNSGTMYVYITSKHLIPRNIIKKAEEAIRLFVFGDFSNNKIVISERYLLSSQYTPENLYKLYEDNIMSELEEKSAVEHALIKDGNVKINENVIFIELKEGMLAKQRKTDIEKYFNHLFASRFGMNINTVVKFVKREITEEKEAEEVKEEELPFAGGSEAVIKRQELENKLEEAYDVSSNEVVFTSDMIKKKAEREPNKKKDYKATAESFKKKNYNDMDCFYGKNTEGDIVPISSIVEEIPNFVVVRGQLFKIETRPIKNEKTIITGYITDFTNSIGFKLFVKNDDLDVLLDELKEGSFVLMKGVPQKDLFLNLLI